MHFQIIQLLRQLNPVQQQLKQHLTMQELSLTYMVRHIYPTARVNYWSAQFNAGFIVTTSVSSQSAALRSGQVGSASNMFLESDSPGSGTTVFGPGNSQTNTLSVNINATNGTTYYIVPFISSISDSVVLNTCYSGPQYADVYVRTPRFINISTSASVSRTEITLSGIGCK